MKDISNEIVNKIREEHVVPESKLKLLWKSYLFWFLMVFMVAVGALSFSLVIFNVIDFNPRLFRHMEIMKIIRVLTFTAPYLWIILSVLAVIFGVLAFKNTERGYRQSALFITSISVLVVAALAVSSHMLRIDKMMRNAVSRNAPGFRGVMDQRGGRWMRSSDGLIGGEVVGMGTWDNGGFEIRSFDNEEWAITYDDETEKVDMDDITLGVKVGVIGRKTGDFSMHAFSIRVFPTDWDGDIHDSQKSSAGGNEGFSDETGPEGQATDGFRIPPPEQDDSGNRGGGPPPPPPSLSF